MRPESVIQIRNTDSRPHMPVGSPSQIKRTESPATCAAEPGWRHYRARRCEAYRCLMSAHSEPKRLTLELSQTDAAIVAAALRQYEPYWSPGDPGAAEKVSELAKDIRDLLDRLRPVQPSRPPGLLGSFARDEPKLG